MNSYLWIQERNPTEPFEENHHIASRVQQFPIDHKFGRYLETFPISLIWMREKITTNLMMTHINCKEFVPLVEIQRIKSFGLSKFWKEFPSILNIHPIASWFIFLWWVNWSNCKKKNNQKEIVKRKVRGKGKTVNLWGWDWVPSIDEQHPPIANHSSIDGGWGIWVSWRWINIHDVWRWWYLLFEDSISLQILMILLLHGIALHLVCWFICMLANKEADMRITYWGNSKWKGVTYNSHSHWWGEERPTILASPSRYFWLFSIKVRWKKEKRR